MESLVQVAVGSSDIAVGISGFGSSSVGPERWRDLALLTGRTTFALRYDAQELPSIEPFAVVPSGKFLLELRARWDRAREGARTAARYLAGWLERWASAGRKILIVGFSLGGFLVWKAIELLPPDLRGNVQVVLVSAALADSPSTWSVADGVDRIVNAYSAQDLVLKWLYPRGVATDETPAAGLGPIIASDLPNVQNVDLTDLIGKDHLWAGENLPRLVRIVLGCLWSDSCDIEPQAPYPVPEVDLSPLERARMYRWTVVVPEWWVLFGDALSGRNDQVRAARVIDAWSISAPDRLESLIQAGSATSTLLSTRRCEVTAARGIWTLSGLVRHWYEETT